MELFRHNLEAYEKVKEQFKKTNRCCVIHPTGTGKSFIALQLILENKECRILYVTSYSANLMHFKDSVEQNVGYVPYLSLRLYAGLNPDERQSYDFIILDEFHRAGAPEWQKAVQQILDDNPDAKILGLSATPIRYLDDGRDMAEEIFDGNIASEISLRNALTEGLLPLPSYTTCVYSFDGEIREATKRLERKHISQDDKKAGDLLRKAKRLLENSNGLEDVFRKKMKNPNGKYLVFCRNLEHLRKMEEESHKWFVWTDKEPHYYELFSEESTDKPYKDFLADDTDTLRLLFCINMLNEGVHVEGIDGVILLRPTESPNVYFQQIGRALSVGTSEHPEIFDIVNNAAILDPVKGFWNGVIGDFEAKGHEFNGSFDVWARDTEIISLLNQIFALTRCRLEWDESYQLCKKFFEEYGHLNIPKGFVSNGLNLNLWLCSQRSRRKPESRNPITEEQIALLDEIGMDWNPRDIDGKWEQMYKEAKAYYEANGNLEIPGSMSSPYHRLYTWVNEQRYRYLGMSRVSITEDHAKRLEEIGISWTKQTQWEKSFQMAKEYYKANGNLIIPQAYRTDSGYPLGAWVCRQRQTKVHASLSPEQIKMLDEIGMKWKFEQLTWDDAFDIAEAYFKEFGNLDVTAKFKYNGYALGDWISRMRKQKKTGKLSEEKIHKLDQIGMIWSKKALSFNESFKYAEAYYKEHGNLAVPVTYKCKDGFALGNWISLQRRRKNGSTTDGSNSLTNEEVAMLDSIGMIWSFNRKTWEESYDIAKNYFLKNHSLPYNHRVKIKGWDLSSWLSTQRRERKRNNLSMERIKMLDELKMIWN